MEEVCKKNKGAPLLQARAAELRVWAAEQGPKRRIITSDYIDGCWSCQQRILRKKKASAWL
jgi:hypothetical protein